MSSWKRFACLILESQHKIVGVPYHDHITLCVSHPPLMRPKIEHIMQEYISQQR